MDGRMDIGPFSQFPTLADGQTDVPMDGPAERQSHSSSCVSATKKKTSKRKTHIYDLFPSARAAIIGMIRYDTFYKPRLNKRLVV